MMLKWGNNLADQLFLPSFVEASMDGAGLYRRYGYYEISKHEGDVEGFNMKRDPQVLGYSRAQLG